MADPQIRAIVRSLEKLAERVVTKITLDVTANLIETTPVDTGWARANWVPVIGQDRIRNLGAITSPDSGQVSQAQGSQQQGIAAVSGFRLADQRIFVSNNVPYIVELNEGSSDQAPSGFVTSAIQKAVTRDIRNFRG